MTNKYCALIPARAGSKRIVGKNIFSLNGRSLIQRSVEVARGVPCISDSFIITDSPEYEQHAKDFGALSIGIRPASTSRDESSDIEWLSWFSTNYQDYTQSNYTHYIILRPTSPFRSLRLVEDAIDLFENSDPDESTVLRCVSRVTEHPGKMWIDAGGGFMNRLMPFRNGSTFWCDSSYSQLPEVYVQNACIEIGDLSGRPTDCLSGYKTIMFVREGIEVFDINTINDIQYAEFLCLNNPAL